MQFSGNDKGRDNVHVSFDANLQSQHSFRSLTCRNSVDRRFPNGCKFRFVAR